MAESKTPAQQALEALDTLPSWDALREHGETIRSILANYDKMKAASMRLIAVTSPDKDYGTEEILDARNALSEALKGDV